ncbi:MAG: tRNA (N6-isopentenyl adenosine(37)-C2)-methylthiotransferase MiaB [Tissierellia bacterium]|nr:tRNA (N6-isopentenyl adenosine(37)-C2)-methylthiotransferase MiaB [Tissierellia bacterium]
MTLRDQQINSQMEAVRGLYDGSSYYIETHGCQMNEHDSHKIATLLEEMGFQWAPEEEADFVLLNTCSVRHSAEDKVIGHIGRLKHEKEQRPHLKVGVCGCMMQRDESRNYVLSTFPHVDLVFGTNNIFELPRLLLEMGEKKRAVSITDEYHTFDDQLMIGDRNSVREYVNIMYGCNNFCTYCIVPYTRGRETSRPVGDILEEVKLLGERGVKEIVLLGQNVNSYGKNLQEVVSFPELLRQVHEVPGIERIQFLTSHPKDISRELIDSYGDLPKLASYLHLPVQSGSNDVLKRMNRHYTREQYLEIVAQVRRARPDIALSTDIIVGFPGETEEDFQDTLDLVREVRYDSAFTFLYSRRSGTKADTMEDQIDQDVKNERFQRLLEVVYAIQKEKNEALFGTTQQVLFESVSKKDATRMTGRTSGYKLVHAPYDETALGKIVPVRIEGGNTFSLEGTVLHG